HHHHHHLPVNTIESTSLFPLSIPLCCLFLALFFSVTLYWLCWRDFTSQCHCSPLPRSVCQHCPPWLLSPRHPISTDWSSLAHVHSPAHLLTWVTYCLS